MTGWRYYGRIGGTLLIICTAVALLLAAVNVATRDVIAAGEQREREAATISLFPTFTEMEELAGSYPAGVHTVYRIAADGSLLGYAVNLETRGFGGMIQMVVGLDTSGAVCGLRVLSHAETPGLGSRAMLEGYLAGYRGMRREPVLGEDIDAVSGATISSRAVKNGVALALSLRLGGGEA